jgi:hypothetical protein
MLSSHEQGNHQVSRLTIAKTSTVFVLLGEQCGNHIVLFWLKIDSKEISIVLIAGRSVK